jgi:uncharacterized membrane protein
MRSRSVLLALASSSLLLTACGGGDDGGTTPNPTPAFTLAVSPTALSVQAGGAANNIAADIGLGETAAAQAGEAAAGTGTINVTISRSGGFEGAVTLTVEGLPSGVTASALTIAPGLSTGTITITAGATATVGNSTLTVRGTGTGVTAQTATVQLTITPAPSIAIALAPAAVSVSQGGSGTSTVNITRNGGFAGAVNLTSSGAPSGMTVTFNPASATGATSTATVNVGAAVAAGNYPITITAGGTGVSNVTATLTVTVTAPPAQSISLALAPASLSIQQGQQGTSVVTITRNNVSGAVALTAQGAPAGMTVSFNPANPTGNTSDITVAVAATVAPGAYPVTIQGAGTGFNNATATLTVTVTAAPASGITLALNPTALSIQAGNSGTSALTITRTNFSGAVALTASGQPAGMTITFNPTSVTGNTSDITVAVAGTVAAGTYPVTIQGAGTGIANVTAVLTVTVTAAPGSVVLSLNPAALSITQGQSLTSTLTITRTNFTGTVNLTSSGAPSGVTVSFNPASTTGTTSTVTVNVGTAVAAGNYTITIQAAGTGISNATTTLALTVNASGGSGNVVFTFCSQSGIPLWVAYSSNGGPWTQVSGVNNVYSFNITTRGAVAYVLPGGGNNTTLNIVYGTQQELTSRGVSQCVGTGATKTINVTAQNVGANQSALVSMRGGTAFFFGGGPTTAQLQNVSDGLADLIGVRSSPLTPPSTPNSIVIQRDLNVANNGSVTVDFATGITPLARTTTIANLGTQQAIFSAIFVSKNLTSALISSDIQGSTNLTRNWFGIPDGNTVAGDFHLQSVSALNIGNTTGYPSRGVSIYNRLATNQTLTLPPAIVTPPTINVVGTSPYVTLNSNWVIEGTSYNAFWTLSFTPSSGNAAVVLSGSSAYFGNGPVQLNIPTFGAGFNPVWGLQPGVSTTWIFFAAGGPLYSSGTGEGQAGTFATVGGVITP